MTQIKKFNKLKANLEDKPNWYIEKIENADFKYRIYHKYDKKAIDFETSVNLIGQDIKFKSSKTLNSYLFEEVFSIIKQLYALFNLDDYQTIKLATLNGRLEKLKQQYEVIEDLEKDYRTSKNLFDVFQIVVDINEKPHLLTHDDLISVKTSQPMLIKIKQQLNQRIKATNQQINKVKKEEANNEN